MKMGLKMWIVTIAVAIGGFVVGSCDSIDTAFDCQSVCSRYRDCFDANYNVDNCRNKCRTNAANDPNVKGAADACEACIGDRSCVGSAVSCSGSCSAIVP
jgi:hypothetical protein